MFQPSYPLAPMFNPRIEEGIYEATIEQIENKTYGENESPMVRLVFRIPSEEIHFVSHIYFPDNYSPGAQQRLWHFCCCVRRDPADIFNDPEVFKDRRLRLKVVEYTPKASSSYCDVQAFYPSEQEWGASHAHEDW